MSQGSPPERLTVSEAVAYRKSIRAFTDEPISDELLRELLLAAARSPSGGNVQPWRIYVLNGEVMQRFKAHVRANFLRPEEPAYEIYPSKLKEPYRTSRYRIGEQMYELLGIGRDDKAARLRRMAENFNFFGAPAGLFCFVDRCMGPPQWSDLGMFLQTFMLLAAERGLDSCPQEAWSQRARSVTEFIEPPEELMLFCGVAVGHRDVSAEVNRLESEREPEDVWLNFVA